MSAWATWVNPGHPDHLYALFYAAQHPTRVLCLSPGGGVEDITARWFPHGPPDYDPKLDVVDCKVLQHEDTIFARAYSDERDEVYAYQMSDQSAEWRLVDTLPPGLVRLRGGGLALVELE